MTEKQTPEARDIKTEGGNYNERIGKHYIHAETVHIYETACNPSAPSTNNGKVTASQKQLAFAIAGSFDEVDHAKLKAILALLQKISGDATIEIIRVEEGSIKIILNGSDEGLGRIKQLFESGELTEVLGTSVEYVDLTELDEKSCLIRDILQNGASSQNLSNADLRGADLRGADLRGADLRGADLSHADLRGADLSGADLRNTNLRDTNLKNTNLRSADFSGAIIDYSTKFDDKLRLIWEIVTQGAVGRNLKGVNLSRANLKGTNLTHADLSHADLSDADLSGARLIYADLSNADLSGANLIHANLIHTNLSGANLENAQFGNNQGISETIKGELVQKGAIFKDSPGDRSRILLPR